MHLTGQHQPGARLVSQGDQTLAIRGGGTRGTLTTDRQTLGEFSPTVPVVIATWYADPSAFERQTGIIPTAGKPAGGLGSPCTGIGSLEAGIDRDGRLDVLVRLGQGDGGRSRFRSSSHENGGQSRQAERDPTLRTRMASHGCSS
jgi:hypothetical protein